MIPIKIQCGCGQKYAFDVEAPAGVMPYPVACPVCGTDGTAAASLAIAQYLPAQAAGAPPPPPSPGLPSPTVRRSAAGVPLMEPAQVVIEAKAKISWGDSQDEVIEFMMMNGIPIAEARGMVGEMFQERAAMIRKHGIMKMVKSIPLMCVPLGTIAIFNHVGYWSVRLFGLALLVGLIGAWLLLKGTIMFFSPKSEPGDVADK